MSKIAIPMKCCISVTPNLTGSPNITGVRYNAVQKEIKTTTLENFNLDYLLITRDSNGNITNVTVNPEFDYEIKQYVGAWTYDYVDLKIYVENYYLKYADLYDAMLQADYIKYFSGTPYFVAGEEKKSTYTWASGVVPASLQFTHLRDENGLYISLKPDIKSTSTVEIGHNKTFQISLPQILESSNISTLVGVESSDKVFELTTNDYTDNDSKIGGIPIAQYNSNKILMNYNRTKQTIEAKLIMANYYDVDGNLVIDKSKGEILQVGDEIVFSNFNSKEMFINKTFEITSCEFNYNGVPKMLIQAKEILDLEKREFKINLVNPEYMIVEYSYLDYLNATLTGRLERSDILDDIKSNANVAIHAQGIAADANYYYGSSSAGGNYGPATKEITITGIRQPHIRAGNNYNRNVNGTLATSDIFADYTGRVIFQGRVYATLSNGAYLNIVGTSSTASSLNLQYSSYYNGWVIIASDVPIDEEEDYNAGHVIILIDSTGVRIIWDISGNEYNVYTITKLYVYADSIRKV